MGDWIERERQEAFPAGIQGFGPLYQDGHLSIESDPDFTGKNVNLGVQVAPDGRVWLCIDGVAWARFKPRPNVG